jgi:hypothetical protein
MARLGLNGSAGASLFARHKNQTFVVPDEFDTGFLKIDGVDCTLPQSEAG